MLIKIDKFEYTEVWDGVLYKKLSDYPNISEWELQGILDFIRYEEANGRSCSIEAEEAIRERIDLFIQSRPTNRVPVPEKITECTACPNYKGCMTDLVCHTSPIENAVRILDCGSLLSPVRARNMSAAQLRSEKRNAANDPEDYFDYIMFSWGNCQAGDRLVMERKLGRFPDERDLSEKFTPGVRFFFSYERLVRHPEAVFDGVLPLKVRNEVVLSEWVSSVIIPEEYRGLAESHIPDALREKVHFIKNDCRDIWEWSEKVYEFAKAIEKRKVT